MKISQNDLMKFELTELYLRYSELNERLTRLEQYYRKEPFEDHCSNCQYSGDGFVFGHVMIVTADGVPLRARICPECKRHASVTSGWGGI